LSRDSAALAVGRRRGAEGGRGGGQGGVAGGGWDTPMRKFQDSVKALEADIEHANAL
jgi:hypothetical protein